MKGDVLKNSIALIKVKFCPGQKDLHSNAVSLDKRQVYFVYTLYSNAESQNGIKNLFNKCARLINIEWDCAQITSLIAHLMIWRTLKVKYC